MINSYSSSPLRAKKAISVYQSPNVSNGLTLSNLIGEITADHSGKTLKCKKIRFSKPSLKQRPIYIQSKQKISTKLDTLPNLAEKIRIFKTKRELSIKESKKMLMDSIQKLPEILTSSEELINKVTKSNTECIEKTYNTKISNYLAEQKMPLDQHVSILDAFKAMEYEEDSRMPPNWKLKYKRRSIEGIGNVNHEQAFNFHAKRLSNNYMNDIDSYTKSSMNTINKEVYNPLSEIKEENSKLQNLLRKATVIDPLSEDFLKAVKEDNEEQVRRDIEISPMLVKQAFTVYIYAA